MFNRIAISSITVHREDRQRRAITDIADLASSINRLGLINPITIDHNNILVAGERRLEACRSLGWTHIPAQFLEDLSEEQHILIELEENIKRQDITWQEHTAAIAKYHAIRSEQEPAWSAPRTADEIGMSRQNVVKHLTVARELSSPLVKQAPTFATAVERANSEARKRDDLIHIVAPCDNTHQILTTDFRKWSKVTWEERGLAQPEFNFIHCDFPYGINSHTTVGQNSSNQAKYDDTEEIYWSLFESLIENIDNFCAPNAHMIFWFSPNLYCRTKAKLAELPDFTFEEHPLIWGRSPEGIAPDPYRRPRRVYEMAFFGWRGEARINTVRENLFSAPTERERHPHEKSQTMLEYFFGMFVDTHTRLLDPTCGSGSSLRAALSLNAGTVLGLEINEEFADVARRNLPTT